MDQAESLRIIKASRQARPLARVITVTSGKGGVGKSNTAINLAIWLKKLGKRVIILDADFGLANIEIMFGTVPKHNLCDLIYQGKNIKDIITWGPGEVGFISGGSGIAGMSNLSNDYLNYIIQNLSELDSIADIIIVDTGAGISDAVLEFLVASGEILLIKQKSFMECLPETVSKQCFLVLSATTKYKDLKKIVDNYRSVSDFQLIFTKLDETSTLGSLYNITCYSDSSIAFVTCGQNVPDDIETFNAQRIVKQLLGGE